jgi:hypothetical protein
MVPRPTVVQVLSPRAIDVPDSSVLVVESIQSPLALSHRTQHKPKNYRIMCDLKSTIDLYCHRENTKYSIPSDSLSEGGLLHNEATQHSDASP